MRIKKTEGFSWNLPLSAGEQGFEPRYHDPESCVLPLDDSPGTVWLDAV